MWNQGGDGGGGIEWSEAGTNDGCAEGHTSTAVSPSQLRQCQISIIKSSVLVCAHTNSWVAWEEKVGWEGVVPHQIFFPALSVLSFLNKSQKKKS